MRMLITGATGLIGGEILLESLSCQDIESIGVLVRGDGLEEARQKLYRRIGRVQTEELTRSGYLQVLLGDICQPNIGKDGNLRRMLDRIDTVVHCAAETSFIRDAQCEAVNIDGLSNFLGLIKKYNSHCRFVYFGTAAACGIRRGWIEADAQFPTDRGKHLWHYGYTKAVGENLVRALIPDRCLILRPSVVIGSHNRTSARSVLWGLTATHFFDFLPIEQIAGMDVVSVEDVARWTLALLQRQSLPCQTFFLSSGNDGFMSARELADTVAAVRQRPNRLKFVSPREWERNARHKYLDTPFRRKIFAPLSLYLRYVNLGQRYDNSRIVNYVGNPLRPPKDIIAQAVEKIELDDAIEESVNP